MMGCKGNSNANTQEAKDDAKGKKILIAYYSRRGMNYTDKGIVDLKTGNTERMALMIQKHVGGDLFRIDTKKSYPADYTQCTEVAKQEKNDNARPELNDTVKDIAQYDVVYIGYPIWWGTFPMAVFTFLEQYDLSG